MMFQACPCGSDFVGKLEPPELLLVFFKRANYLCGVSGNHALPEKLFVTQTLPNNGVWAQVTPGKIIALMPIKTLSPMNDFSKNISLRIFCRKNPDASVMGDKLDPVVMVTWFLFQSDILHCRSMENRRHPSHLNPPVPKPEIICLLHIRRMLYEMLFIASLIFEAFALPYSR